MILNLFVAVVLEQYAEERLRPAPIVTREHVAEFRSLWAKFDPELTGFVHVGHLAFLLRALPPPLGLCGEASRDLAALESVHVTVAAGGSVYFGDVLQALFGFAYRVNLLTVPEEVMLDVLRSTEQQRRRHQAEVEKLAAKMGAGNLEGSPSPAASPPPPSDATRRAGLLSMLASVSSEGAGGGAAGGGGGGGEDGTYIVSLKVLMAATCLQRSVRTFLTRRRAKRAAAAAARESTLGILTSTQIGAQGELVRVRQSGRRALPNRSVSFRPPPAQAAVERPQSFAASLAIAAADDTVMGSLSGLCTAEDAAALWASTSVLLPGSPQMQPAAALSPRTLPAPALPPAILAAAGAGGSVRTSARTGMQRPGVARVSWNQDDDWTFTQKPSSVSGGYDEVLLSARDLISRALSKDEPWSLALPGASSQHARSIASELRGATVSATTATGAAAEQPPGGSGTGAGAIPEPSPAAPSARALDLDPAAFPRLGGGGLSPWNNPFGTVGPLPGAASGDLGAPGAASPALPRAPIRAASRLPGLSRVSERASDTENPQMASAVGEGGGDGGVEKERSGATK